MHPHIWFSRVSLQEISDFSNRRTRQTPPSEGRGIITQEESAGIRRMYPTTCIRLQGPCLVPALKQSSTAYSIIRNLRMPIMHYALYIKKEVGSFFLGPARGTAPASGCLRITIKIKPQGLSASSKKRYFGYTTFEHTNSISLLKLPMAVPYNIPRLMPRARQSLGLSFLRFGVPFHYIM